MQVNLNKLDNIYTGNIIRTKSDLDFSISQESSEEVEDTLSYYNKLCREFGGITFRLDDVSEAAKHVGSTYLGYGNSHNQIGDSFGNKGQCSISLDVSVIERMQKDSKYAERVRGMIKNTYDRYSEFESKALEDGYPYISVAIEDNNGMPTRSIQQSAMPYSGEEEMQASLGDKGISRTVSLKFEEQKKSLLDSYMKMYDESRERMRKVLELKKS